MFAGRVAVVLGISLAIASSSSAQNLLVNPDFDSNVVGWSVGAQEFISIAWSSVDATEDPTGAGGTAGSGALDFEIATTGYASQCVPVIGGQPYRLSGSVAPLSIGSGSALFSLALQWWTTADCTEDVVGAFDVIASPTELDVWHLLDDVFDAPPTANSVEVRLAASAISGVRTARFDALYLPEPAALGAALAACGALAAVARRRAAR